MIRLGKLLVRSSRNVPCFGFGFKKLPFLTQIDSSNILTLASETGIPQQTVWQKFSNFSLTNTYYFLDAFSREFIFYLSQDWKLGLGTAIFVTALGVKLAFSPFTLRMMRDTEKIRLAQTEMSAFQNKIMMAQQARNADLMRRTQLEYTEMRRKNNISSTSIMLNMLQIPLTITLFFSIRYVLSVPQLFPQVRTQGLLWFQDLSTYDGYMMLPFISALLSYYNISMSQRRSTGLLIPIMATIQQYLKYMPFVMLLLMIWYPSGLSLYWCALSLGQAIQTSMVNAEYFRKLMGLSSQTQPYHQEKVIKAYVVEQLTGGRFKEQPLVKPKEEAHKMDALKQESETVHKNEAKTTKPKQTLQKDIIGEKVQILRQKPKKQQKKE